MKLFHPFDLIAINQSELTNDLKNDKTVKDVKKSIVNYYRYVENILDIPEKDLYKLNDESKIPNYKVLLKLNIDFIVNKNKEIFNEFISHLCIGDYFYDGESFYVFSFLKGPGIKQGIAGFGFTNLTTKKDFSFLDFFKIFKDKDIKLSFMGNMYLQTLPVLKEIILDIIKEKHPSKLKTESSEKRILSNIVFVYNKSSRFNLFISEENGYNYIVEIQDNISLKSARDALSNIWNIELNVVKAINDYKIIKKNMYDSISLRCITGTFFIFDEKSNITDEELKNLVKKDEFKKQKQVFSLLNPYGEVILSSLNDTNIFFSLKDDKLMLPYNSFLYKKINPSFTIKEYVNNFLKII